MKATEETAGLAESNGSLLPDVWRDSLHVPCGMTACTPGSAPGPTLGNEYGKTLPYLFYLCPWLGPFLAALDTLCSSDFMDDVIFVHKARKRRHSSDSVDSSP